MLRLKKTPIGLRKNQENWLSLGIRHIPKLAGQPDQVSTFHFAVTYQPTKRFQSSILVFVSANCDHCYK